MLKAYVYRWRLSVSPEESDKIDHWFTSEPAKAATWFAREDAQNDCATFDRHRIEVVSEDGKKHVCSGFQIEEVESGEFVVFCLTPFVPQ